jgi:hypothetical protein
VKASPWVLWVEGDGSKLTDNQAAFWGFGVGRSSEGEKVPAWFASLGFIESFFDYSG